MKDNIWKQNYSAILVGVKFLGIWWEFWRYPYLYGIDHNTHFQNVKQVCKNKFGKKSFRMRLYYPDDIRIIN